MGIRVRVLLNHIAENEFLNECNSQGSARIRVDQSVESNICPLSPH
jgi:hypothetical protein